MNAFLDNKNNKELGKLIHVGAGNGIELNSYITQKFTDIVLLEPLPKLFKQLQSKITKLQKANNTVNILALNVALHGKVKGQKTEALNSTFYVTQPNRYSGFHKASKLKVLFQNLKTEEEITVNTISLTELINDSELDVNKSNTLVLQVNSAENQVLEAATEEELMSFSNIVIQHTKNSCFEDAKPTNDLVKLMKTKGFQLALEESNDVVFSHLIFRKDEKALEITSLNETTAVQANHITQLENQLKSSNEAKAGAINKTTDLEVQLAEQNKNKSNLISELKNQLKASNEAKSGAINKTTDLEAKLAEQNEVHAAIISKLEESLKNEIHWHIVHKDRQEGLKGNIEKLEAQLAEKEKQLTHIIENQNSVNDKMLHSIVNQVKDNHQKDINELKKHINWKLNKGFSNSVKQVESFIGVQSFLETGQLAMEYHGWPISSDIALFLLGKIQSNNYDLIIEFGSGTSTNLFAKAMLKQVDVSLGLTEKDNKYTNSTSDKRVTDVIGFSKELPQRVLTFEHNKKYYDTTLASLKQNGLDNVVNLVHAPLVDFLSDGESYLYYDCDKSLDYIADIYRDRTANILVLIDGPPGSTCPLARFPAITKLLNVLGNHQLDLVLDDYDRKEEQDIVERWKNMFEARFIQYKEEIVPCEKGAWFCRVN
jgi:FkbM family methyltransferase